jgi:hypothetical protein
MACRCEHEVLRFSAWCPPNGDQALSFQGAWKLLLPSRMFADIGGEHFHNRPVVSWRVAGNPFQSVDAAEAELELVAPELIDGSGKAVGDLTFLRDKDPAPGEREAAQDHQAADDVRKRASGFVFEFEPIFRGKLGGSDLPLQYLPQRTNEDENTEHPSEDFQGQRMPAPTRFYSRCSSASLHPRRSSPVKQACAPMLEPCKDLLTGTGESGPEALRLLRSSRVVARKPASVCHVRLL